METLDKKKNKVIIDDGTIVKYLPISRPLETYQLLLFKQLNYDFDEYV
jgi:hypothetical protein